MPPSGFQKEVVKANVSLARALYTELRDKVRAGEYASYDEAIEAELAQLGKFLERAHLTPEGELVER